MKTFTLPQKTLLVLMAGAGLAQASDFTGVYARIDRVVLAPNAEAPETIQVFGVFALAKPNDRNDYLPAERGYLYFRLGGNREAALKEWADLKEVAGTAQIVAFGIRGQTQRLRKTDERPADPDQYFTNVGLQKVRARDDYAPVRDVLDFKK